MTTAIDPRSLLERVAALEEAVKHLASKEDLEKLRTELLVAIERGQVDLLIAIDGWGAKYERTIDRHTRWTVGTIVATGALAVAAIKLL